MPGLIAFFVCFFVFLYSGGAERFPHGQDKEFGGNVVAVQAHHSVADHRPGPEDNDGRGRQAVDSDGAADQAVHHGRQGTGGRQKVPSRDDRNRDTVTGGGRDRRDLDRHNRRRRVLRNPGPAVT